jgi:hippurate hydrolase
MANVDAVELVVHGKGGHGAKPQETVDPVVIAARTVVALQTLVAREVNPTDPAVVTVGSIHGGTKSNIIPDEVKLQLTVRSFKDEVQKHLLDGIRRIARAEAAAAGAPQEPTVTVTPDTAHATWNDPALDGRLAAALTRALGAENVVDAEPQMGAEDFSEVGRAGIPAVDLQIGAVDAKALAKARAEGKSLPGLHSSGFAPVREPTIRTGVTVLVVSAMELLGKP